MSRLLPSNHRLPRKQRSSWLYMSYALAALLTAGSIGLVSCADGGMDSAETSIEQAATACDCGLGAPVVDPALLAFLSKAKSLHHRADIAVEEGHPGVAIVALEKLVGGPLPQTAPDTLGPEAREVVADSLARLAELRSADGKFDDAIEDIDRGLELATEVTHYRGRLMEVRGLVEQRRHKQLLADGDQKGANVAKDRAIAAFEKAVEIQDQVISSALDDLDATQ